ncbi:MAG: type IV pilus twitching motility protein PilT [Candidatus Levybacteria bacterium]|nr:type IV pilus twitching motility protein PilT [Candidatus Levybacteria bacterium]
MDLQKILSLIIQNNASDLHLIPGLPPMVRVDGELMPLPSFPMLTRDDVEALVYRLLTPEQKELLLANKELDFSFGFGTTTAGGEIGRFRGNAYYQRGMLCAAFRFLPPVIKTVEELNLPKVLHNFVKMKQGFIIVCGPTGHGKSTTIASIINEINMQKAAHILTIEDPIEFVYPKGKSIISQREMGMDTHSWAMALRSALREDPDVVFVGEMRDPETMAAAITIAETGHLVFSTLHTNSAAQSIDRIVDSFPAHQQPQVRIQLSSTLKGIISQRLIPRLGGGRVVAAEVLIGTPAVASNIREGKTHLIDSVIQTSQEAGMIPLEASLSQLVLSGAITLEVAKSYAMHQEELLRLVA